MYTLISKTGERIIPENFESREEYLLWLRHLFAYKFTQDITSKDSFVLEVGCGEGYGTSFLSQNVAKIIGLDIDNKTILHASKKYGSGNCIFKLYDGRNIPYNDNTFDVVISFHVIEHIRDDINYISEIYRVLKKKGVLIITTPNRAYRLKLGQKPFNRFHVREYYLQELEKILKNKFSDVKLWGIRGTEDVNKMEIDRINKIRRIISLDRFNFRRLIPESIKILIINILKTKILINNDSKNSISFRNKYSLANYYIIKDHIEESLELLGICNK